jgi:5,10-methylene-tetrahydrofolate dehydrogenase/Methenyl tetrahydrofolate cyclohydrolase
MTATILDGKALGARIDQRTAERVRDFVGEHGRRPCLTVVLVGDDPASHVYVRNKIRRCGETGIESREHRLGADVGQDELLRLIQELNHASDVDGILVQLPLPAHIDAELVLEAIAPQKDVDGFHPDNAGRLACGMPRFVPCTPRGSMHLIREVHDNLQGLHAVVVGRSTIVGRPMAQLLLMADATVTMAHSKTKDLSATCLEADILVAAVGRPGIITGEMVKPGATVIDVGINRIDDGGKGRLVGDVAYDQVVGHAGAITPVPGGVGPMTIACLLENTVDAALMQINEPVSIN